MQIVPVIDLMHGQVVSAVRGERHAYRPVVSPLVAGSDPCDVARALLARCLPSALLYVADLDAIQGNPPQHRALAALLAALPGVTGPTAALALRNALGPDGSRVRPVYGSETLADAASLAADPEAILSLDCRRAQPLDRAGCWQQPACGRGR
jgi:uncharacterized protein related to proFAR isomerase